MPNVNFYHKDAIEIHYVLKGNVCHVVNSTKYVLEEGDMCFIAPNTSYSLFIADDNVVMLSIIVYTDTLKNILNNIVSSDDILSDFFQTDT